MLYIIFPIMVACVAGLSILPAAPYLPAATGLIVYPFVLGFFPILDMMIRKLDRPDNTLTTKPIHQLALLIVLPLMLTLILGGLYRLNMSSEGFIPAMMMGVAIGMYSGAIGMTAAHELIHRTSPRWRALGIGILVLVQYGHFRIEHIYGHHIHVATEKDPATARKGEGYYRFLIRCIFMSYVSAFAIERRRMINKKIGVLSRHNRMLHYLVMQAAILGISYAIAGFSGLVFVLTQAAVAIILTEAVDYIQHYGLMREQEDGKTQPIQPEHSWNSRHAVGDWTTFNIGLHSHHHTSGTTPYPELSQQQEHHEMPGNYAVMILMALLPLLWFKVMDERLPA